MADPRFFTNKGPFRIHQLAQITGSNVEGPVDGERLFLDIAPLDVATAEDVSFLDNPKYLGRFKESRAGACFVHPKHKDSAPEGMVLLLSENPYLAYAMAATAFYPPYQSNGEVSSRAHVDQTATLGIGTQIDAGAYIGKHVIIGQNCHIGPNAVLMDGVMVGDHTSIGANATLSHTIVGKHCILHPGVHLGQDGFGFAKSPKGAVKVPQLGRVVVEDWVEIGAGTCIDRGAGPDTIIGMGSKIDNLVQIGHNVKLGRSVIVVSQVGISGSTEVGDGATLAGQVGVAGHIRIGKGATLAAKSGVAGNIPDGEIYGGIPAMPMQMWRKQVATLSLMTRKKGTKNDD